MRRAALVCVLLGFVGCAGPGLPPEHQPEAPDQGQAAAALEGHSAVAVGPPERWTRGAVAAPARVDPPPTSVLGRLPETPAVALVSGESTLVLVAAQPSDWRLELATGSIANATFEPATGLVLFSRDDAIWAVDLREPLATEDTKPTVIELARIPGEAADLSPSALVLCFPTADPGYTRCWPEPPVPNEVDFDPEYIEIVWADTPSAAWHLGEGGDGEDWEETPPLPLTMVGSAWLGERADRRAGFATIPRQIHGYYEAAPLADVAALDFDDLCLDAEDCGKSLPLGVSGLEWVVVHTDQGDLFHPFFAAYDPSRKRWANWDALTEGKGAAAWIDSAALGAGLEALGEEHYVLFDGSGRAFASPLRDQLCQFEHERPDAVAVGVRCDAVGGEIVAFLSVSVELGQY